MKKTLLVMVTALSLVACKNSLENDGTAKNKLESQLSAKLSSMYREVGNQHNDTLADFYYGNEANRSVSYRNLSIENYFGSLSEVHHIKTSSFGASRNSEVKSDSAASYMAENGLVSECASELIAQVENILNNPLDSLEATQNAITELELNLLNEKSEDEITEFLCYAETAKASLEFWNDNIEKLDSVSQKSGRWLWNWWNEHKHRLAMMAASDAAGAAAGALVGGASGGPQGAAIGAAVAGAASSAMGYATDSVCIVVPLDKILNRM